MEETKYEKLVKIIEKRIERLKRKRQAHIKNDRIHVANHILKDIEMLESILKEAAEGDN